MRTPPLNNLVVVALEQAVAAPLCTSRLAEAGARVIKIERAEGDFAREYDHVVHGESAYFVWLNRGKESLVLDLKDPSDASLLTNILACADVFVQNLAPGAALRAGFGSAELRARHPRLITCDITGYGETGPMRDMKAYDLLIQCETGLASVTGTPDAPGRVGVSIADIACGMYAHAAVLQALIEREQTVVGSGISVSLFDAIADWMTVPFLHAFYGGAAPKRVGLAHPSISPYGAFVCADGRPVVIAIQNEREWRIFCTKILGAEAIADDPRFASNAQRVAHRAACEALVEERIKTLSHADAAQILRQTGIAFASVNSVDDLLKHPQLRTSEVDTPSGTTRIIEPAPRWFGAAYRGRPVPSLGQHNTTLRKEFG